MNETEMDLNIDNYTVDNLKDFFGINNRDISTVDFNELKKQYETIISQSETNHIQKMNLLSFIDKGISRLLYTFRYTANIGVPDSVNILKRNELRDNATQRTDNLGDLLTQDILFSQNGSHMVVTPQPVPFVYTSPGENFGGVINPLEKRILIKQIGFDTFQRDNYINTEASSVTFQLREPLKKVTSMQIVSIELPRMWHTFSKENKNVDMIINLYNLALPPNNVSVPIELPDGNYTPTNFASTMNNILKNNTYLNILLCYVDEVNGKTVFALDPTVIDTPTNPMSPAYSPTFYYEVVFLSPAEEQDIKSTLGWYIGFRQPSYVVNQTPPITSYTYSPTGATSFYGFLQSESTFGSSIENYLYIEVDDFNNNYSTNIIVSQSFKSFIGQSILGRVTLNNAPYTIVENNKSDLINRTREYFGPVSITKLKVRILNKFGIPVNLLQNDYSFVLEFKQLYTP